MYQKVSIKCGLPGYNDDRTAMCGHYRSELNRTRAELEQSGSLYATDEFRVPREVFSRSPTRPRRLPEYHAAMDIEVMEMSSEVDDCIKKLSMQKGVKGVIVTNGDGVPIKTTMDPHKTILYTALVTQLCDKGRSAVKDLDPSNDLTFLRLRSKMQEIMIAVDFSYLLIVVQAAVEEEAGAGKKAKASDEEEEDEEGKEEEAEEEKVEEAPLDIDNLNLELSSSASGEGEEHRGDLKDESDED